MKYESTKCILVAVGESVHVFPETVTINDSTVVLDVSPDTTCDVL